MKKVNHYVAWEEEFHGNKWAYCQGFAETEEEFRQMCEDRGYDINGLETECVKENARDQMGRSCKKRVELD